MLFDNLVSGFVVFYKVGFQSKVEQVMFVNFYCGTYNADAGVGV